MIIVSLKHHILEVKDVPAIYRRSKMEALAWTVTYLAVIIIDVDIGLYAGIIFSIVLIIARSQRARISTLGHLPGTQIFECIETCPGAVEFTEIKIIRYEESIWYGNVDNFKYQIYKTTGIDPLEITKKLNKAKMKLNKSMSKEAKKAITISTISRQDKVSFETETNTVSVNIFIQLKREEKV
jgi:MFS superfamily sulfate permease-like transporter